MSFLTNKLTIPFAEVGYEKATTNAIAASAAISPGVLYQFFPNKEAIAQALAARSIEELLAIYDITFSLEAAKLPLGVLLEHIIDPLVAFSRANPGFLALLVGSQISPQLPRFGPKCPPFDFRLPNFCPN